MTEKRFTYDYEDDKYYDKGFFKDNGKELYKDELLECLNKLHEENLRLKTQLSYNGSDVCDICKHQYLVKTNNYYIAKCEKEHEECSKDYLKYCTDFEIKNEVTK